MSGSTEVTRQGRQLRFESVTVAFSAEVMALDQVSLTAESGCFLSIVGTSGCGKSTLLNLAAGFFKPTAGKVVVDGAVVDGPDPSRGMVFQEDAVFPWFNVAQNIGYPLRWGRLDRKARQRRVAELIELVGLTGREQALPRELSGGMRKRVDIARALAGQPDVLLLDEPFAALDALTKARMQQEFLAIWEQSRPTVIFITHDLEEALFLSDQVIVMRGHPGRIIRSVEVPFARPRPAELRASSELQELRQELADALIPRNEMSK